MKLIDLSWGFSLMGIVGSLLNIKKKKSCFIVWSLSNIGWILLAIWTPEFRGQTPLWIVFTIINVWGYLQWRKN